MLKKYVQEQFVDRGMVADICVHRDNPNNPHAHIMLTMRPFNERGEWGNKKRKEYLFDEQGNKILDAKGKPKYKTHFITDWDKDENVTKWREAWSNEINRELEKKGIEQRVSHLSYEKQGIDKVPTIHLGHIAHAMEKKGKRTEKGDLNRDITAYNELNELIEKNEKYRGDLQKKYKKEELEERFEKFYLNFTAEENEVWEKAKEYLKKPVIALSDIEKRMDQLHSWSERIAKNQKYLSWKAETIEQAKNLYTELQKQQSIIQNNKLELENINWKNPLKIKENKQRAEGLNSATNYAKEQIQNLESKLQYPKEKLKFATYKEFEKVENNFKTEYLKDTNSNQEKHAHIYKELDVLQRAAEAYKSNFVRVVGGKYPDSPEMAYIDFKTAQNIEKTTRIFGRQLKSDEIVYEHRNLKERVEKLEPTIEKIKKEGNPSTLKRLEDMQPQIKQLQQTFSLLDSIINGIQQAQQQQQRDNKQKHSKRTKKHMKSYELER